MVTPIASDRIRINLRLLLETMIGIMTDGDTYRWRWVPSRSGKIDSSA
jgi:hypothetical protein